MDYFRIIEQKCTNKQICLYGARKFGKIALEHLKEMQFEIVNFIDDNFEIQHTFVEGIEVISLREAKEKYRDELVIIISNYYYLNILKQLEEERMDVDSILFIPELLIEDLNDKLIQENQSKIKTVYELLQDNKSKAIYRTVFWGRENKRIDELALLRDDIQYFPSDIIKFKDEVMIDGGAFDGETIVQLQNITGGIKKVYAFEPDPTNQELLRANSRIKCPIEVIGAGLYDRETILRFKGSEGGSSQIDESGENEIKVVALDDLNLDEIPTLIKMDIEGSELVALQGCKNTIIQNKPKLAICIYHKQEDLWEIPLYIKSLVPEYKFYIRNYTCWLDEIVLYGFCEGKSNCIK